MIHHTVFFRMSESAQGNNAEANTVELVRRLHGLLGEIPGLLSMHAGRDFSGSPVSFDVALHSTFASRADLEVYRTHPMHVPVVEFVKAVTSERAVVDYETPD